MVFCKLVLWKQMHKERKSVGLTEHLLPGGAGPQPSTLSQTAHRLQAPRKDVDEDMEGLSRKQRERLAQERPSWSGCA